MSQSSSLLETLANAAITRKTRIACFQELHSRHPWAGKQEPAWPVYDSVRPEPKKVQKNKGRFRVPAIGVGAANVAMINALLDAVIVRLPVSWLLAFALYMGFPGIYYGQALSPVLPAIVGLLYFKVKNGNKKPLFKENKNRKVETGLTEAIKAARIAILPNGELHHLLDILLEANTDD